MTVRPLCGFCGYTLEQCQCKNEREEMNSEQFSISERMTTKTDNTQAYENYLLENEDKFYSVQKLTNLFLDLERDGITGVGLSLVIDLINDRARVN